MDNIIDQIKLSCSQISILINEQNSITLGNKTNNINKSNDIVKKIDLLANDILKNNFKKCDNVSYIASEEDDIILKNNDNGEYLVCFDPLDGSSNISVNITTGTIFGIYKFNKLNKVNIICSGYCLYGACTQLVICTDKIKLYQLLSNHFKLIKDDLKIPNKGKTLSINHCNKYLCYDKRYNQLFKNLSALGYSSRYVGSLVADAHRTLLKGGFFAYPGNIKNPNGKIRLFYEALPFYHIFKTSGGIATNGLKKFNDEYVLQDIHQRTPIILSSNYEYDLFSKL